MINEVISGIAKANGMFGGMNNGMHVCVNNQPPNQSEEESKQVSEEEPESSRIRASNLSVVRRQSVKRKKMTSDMVAS